MEKDNFKQLCVWQGTFMGDNTPKDFEDFFKEDFRVRVMFAEEVVTLPDKDGNGNNIKDTGGRTDILFYIHNDDINEFTLKRFQLGIRWWEDVIINQQKHGFIYPTSIYEKYPKTW